MHSPKYIPTEHFMAPMQPIQAGKTGVPEVISAGGKKAVGKIVFTGNLVAGDTVTINTKVFTCMASGAAGEFQFDVGVSLTASLDALVVVLNACTDPLVSIATYSKTDAGAGLTASFDNYGSAQNSVVLASNHATVVVTQPAGGSDLAYASLDTEHTQFNTAGTFDVYLNDGDESQRKSFAMFGAGTVTLRGAHLPGTAVTLTFTGAVAAVLQFLGGKWRVVLNDGVTVA